MGHREYEGDRGSRGSRDYYSIRNRDRDRSRERLDGMDHGEDNWAREYGRGRGIRSGGSHSSHYGRSSQVRAVPYVKQKRTEKRTVSGKVRETYYHPRYEERRLQDSSAPDKRLKNFKDVVSMGTTIVSSGSIYNCYRGSYGTISNVIIKQVRLGSKSATGKDAIELADNEAGLLYELGHESFIARLLFRGTHEETVHLIMQEYTVNMKEYLSGGRQPSGFHIPLEDVARQLLETLEFLGVKRIAHQDLRLKNLYIERTFSKLSRG